MFNKRLSLLVLPLVIILATVLPGTAASTTKSLSTNFTLVNLGTGAATGSIDYIKPDGSAWKASESFSIPDVGGQLVFRQYTDDALTAGQGSAVVSSDQQLGAVVQIQARNQTPTTGAYAGSPAGSDTVYVPLVAHHGNSVSGQTNSQLVIQNTGTAATSVNVKFYDGAGTLQGTQKNIATLAGGASFLYDLEGESGLANGFVGSAVVTAGTGGTVAVVTNFFLGADTMQTFNGFTKESPSNAWVIPTFFVRLTNGLSSPVTFQNLSDTAIAANGATLTCNVGSTSAVASPAVITLHNTTAVAKGQSYSWNPVVDTANFPTANWTGACRLTTPQNVVAFVQYRFVSGSNARADSYQALNANSTAKTVVIPLVAKRLANNFASAVTIANLNAGAVANVHLDYKPASGYTGSLVVDKVIPAGGSLIQNHRVPYSASNGDSVNLPDNWQGTLTVTSSDSAINAVVQLDFLGQNGDPYMTHNAFTK
jgi:hypothetical protein